MFQVYSTIGSFSTQFGQHVIELLGNFSFKNNNLQLHFITKISYASNNKGFMRYCPMKTFMTYERLKTTLSKLMLCASNLGSNTMGGIIF